MLEVIALDAADAVAAQEGGADRIELVRDMASAGLTPAADTFRAVRAAVDLPVRVMLRENDGFAANDVATLRGIAAELVHAGAEEFVLGFLDGDGAVDLAAVKSVVEVLDGRPWTFHRAIDFADDRTEVWSAIAGLPGLDTVLTSGGAAGIDPDVVLHDLGQAYGPRILVGGGLREEHVASLRAGGVDGFHIGGAARPSGSWEKAVSAEAVRHWRGLLDSSGSGGSRSA
jgi:copper homeostasis protein